MRGRRFFIAWMLVERLVQSWRLDQSWQFKKGTPASDVCGVSVKQEAFICW